MLRSFAGVLATSLAFGVVLASVASSACSDGVAPFECQPGFDACESSELCSTDLSNSPLHCGACGNACPGNANAEPACRDQACVNQCKVGFSDCDGNIGNGCETPTAADVNNCGGCGKKCPAGAVCSGSKCRAVCTDPATGDCNGIVEDGCETILASSKDHCSACDNPCTGGLICVAATCETAPSCKSLVGRQPPLPNGVYRIDPDGDGEETAYDAFCLLDESADGGGWALAAKIDGTKTTFEYGKDIWTSPQLVNDGALALDFDEAKFAPFVRVPALEARIGFREATQATRWRVIPGPATIEGSTATLADAFTLGSLYATSEGRATWGPLVDAPALLEAGCNREGWNVKVGTTSVRVGIVTNATDCDSAGTSFLGIGSKTSESIAGGWRSGSSENIRPVMAYIFVR